MTTGEPAPLDGPEYDVVVVGGGPAGLSAALVLARSLRRVVVVDAGEPRNAAAHGAHGVLGREGIAPLDLLDAGRREVRAYGGEVVAGRAATAGPTADGLVVRLDDGRVLRGRRLLVTSGVADELPDVPGLAERWGRDVVHCPYCHGFELRGRRLAVLATDASGPREALLLGQWSTDVVLLRHSAPEPDDVLAEQLAARGVEVREGRATALVVQDDRLTGVRLGTGTLVPCDALVVAPRLVPRDGLLASLGLPPGPDGVVAVDADGRTEVAGVWAAGNVVDPTVQVVGAAAGGSAAGIALNADLVLEDVRRAVDERRAAAGR
ncbi:NAD(P)/FAD-dependent oxidoreductase [Cellulomonas sp. NS3]|uniref:NAD(P)/FAD-dependent oxidoreductase n=1 Tax=Cellulomonas sp. NS3 TaxID=2973977 RepID=UPI0021613E5D|nr:NAD(P)/FAD-dependent oxidoreductase [Cellulomonas sp. NS3]